VNDLEVCMRINRTNFKSFFNLFVLWRDILFDVICEICKGWDENQCTNVFSLLNVYN